MSLQQSSGLDTRRYAVLSFRKANTFENQSAGSDGDNIVAQFAMSYHNEAAELGVDLDDLYSALVTDANVNPPEWNIHGRQVNVYKYDGPVSSSLADTEVTRREYGYVPFAVFDPASTGRQTREGSRTLEVRSPFRCTYREELTTSFSMHSTILAYGKSPYC